MLLVMKGLLFMKIVESVWFQRLLSYKLYLQIVFPSKKTFVEIVLPNLVEKTINLYV
jgi:hypothetical protein